MYVEMLVNDNNFPSEDAACHSEVQAKQWMAFKVRERLDLPKTYKLTFRVDGVKQEPLRLRRKVA